ncbi:MAG: DUF416 family protein [Anaerobiospirillum succiniciproducens]|uniref:DUF416 family protein n=1 Tax=Anaerobiospirillum succiniciproducens TaxID=13335 RepID=UPI002A76641E|nr:DUF416 family protein [Anaerobiospirillum succiniciproducens]MDY2798356.1 DUF416 family protein [Anaerobiospirillum succiniciproducens]
MIFGERFYPTLQKMPPWRHSLFALALATRAYPNFALWCDIKEQQGKREYLHALKQCWRFHYDKYNHVDLEAAYDIIEPLMPMELEEYSEGDSFAFDASVILDVALESVPFNSKNAKNASMASMASVIRLCENTNPEESDDEEKLLELDPIQAEIDFQVAVMEMVMEPRSADVVKKLLELSLESKCSNIGIESDLTMDDFADSLVQTELSEEELAKRKGAVDPWGANKQANDEDDGGGGGGGGEDELAIEEGSDSDGDNEVANSKEELNTSDEQVADEQLSEEMITKQKIADDESTTEITADEDYSNIDPSEFDEDLELLEEEGESDEAFGDIVLVEDEDGVLTDMTAPFEGDADEEDDNKSNKRHAHRQERRKDHRHSPRREDRRFDRHPRRDREDGEGRRRDRKFGDRPHGDRPHGDRDRKFGDRPHGDRPLGDRDRKFGDRPRSDRPFGDRDRKFGDRPNGDRPHGDRKFGNRPRGDRPFGDRDRKFGDRPNGDRPHGDRKFGDRPRGDRPFGDRDRKFGDRPRGDRPFGDRDRKFGDRPHGDRKFGDRPFGDRKGRVGKFGDRSRHGEAPQKPRVFGPKSN